MRIWLKSFDIIIILAVVCLTFFAAYTAYFKPQGNSHVLIRALNSEWIFPIESNETIVVSGPLGNTIVKIHENSAWVESSPCDNQTCMAAGSIARQGQWAACLPNNVLLIIHGIKDNEFDIIAW
jgi:hypothetical protein